MSAPEVKSYSIPNTISDICHELGHSRQNVYWAITQKLISIPTDKLERHPLLIEPSDIHLGEYLSDCNDDKSRERLDTLLSNLIKDYSVYNYRDNDIHHPNHRKRIEVLLKRAFLEDIFKLYGTWDEHNGKYNFQPIPVKDAHPTIKEGIANQLRHEKLKKHDGETYAQRLHREKPVTEEGAIIANYPRLNKEAGKQVAQLMLQLDGLVTSGFTKEKKQQWLDAVDKKVAEFKEKYPIESIKMEGYRLHILQAEELAKKPHTR